MPRTMNQDAVVNHLLDRQVITRTGIRGRYNVVDGGLTSYRRNDILQRFAAEVEPYRYVIREEEVRRALNWNTPVRRTIRRNSYHTADRDYEAALAQIPVDEDGVRRSFGIEYEIYSLTAEQEDKLARLLDTLPAHVTERDGSLSSTGVEIVFMPVGAAQYIEIVKKLAAFVNENGVRMQQDEYSMAGMHTTYGVSNYTAEKSDLQIRLNRFALAVKAVGTQSAIKRLFGRDFGHYRDLPTSTTYNAHSNAFSTNGRPRSCWECRLPSWKCNPEAMVQFFKATEVAFYRPVEASDFVKVFALLGANTDGE